jgi:quinol monooxygenase YgiN
MNYVLIIHEVADYQKWKIIFDNAAGIRKEAGEISYQLMQFEREPNRIIHLSVWTSLSKAKQFFESPLLVKIREEAGVKQPEFMYLKKLEHGIL